MNELHPVGVAGSRHTLELVDPKFLENGILRAREKSWEIFAKIREQLEAGMTEADARQVCLSTFENAGVTRHWHQPWARFGPGTTLTFYDSIQKDYRLKLGDPVYLDLGPVWPDAELGLEYEGDVGNTFVYGTNPDAEECASTARLLFKEGQDKWRKSPTTGVQMYDLLKSRASELGFNLVEKVDGHRLSDYPHTKYSKGRLSEIEFVPSANLWILELQIVHPTLPIGAFYEDLL